MFSDGTNRQQCALYNLLFGINNKWLKPNKANNDNNDDNLPSLLLDPMVNLRAIILDARLDQLLLNLCQYDIDDAHNQVCTMLEAETIFMFAQLSVFPQASLTLWQINKDNNGFLPLFVVLTLCWEMSFTTAWDWSTC